MTPAERIAGIFAGISDQFSLPPQDTRAGVLANMTEVFGEMLKQGWIVFADPDEKHLIEFREDGWTIQHAVRCRVREGGLFACKINRMAGDQFYEPPFREMLGIYECELIDIGEPVIEIGRKVTPEEASDGG
jgi:hypothetical protein